MKESTRYRMCRVGGHKNGRRIAAHRLLMEKKLGRQLSKDEHVHHVNEVKTDNREDNLEVKHKDDHQHLHHPPVHPVTKVCVVCGSSFTPHKTKRKRQQTCGLKCGYVLMIKNRQINRARST